MRVCVANDAAVGLLQQGKVAGAIEILELAIEEHPESAGLYGSLGEVYEMTDSLELAARSYRSALEIARKTGAPSLPALEGNLQRVQKMLDER